MTGFAAKMSLEAEFLSIYKVMSSIVHADCSSVSSTYLGVIQPPEMPPVLMALPHWAPIVAASTSSYDIFQCSEIAEALGLKANDRFAQLNDEWKAANSKYLSGVDGTPQT